MLFDKSMVNGFDIVAKFDGDNIRMYAKTDAKYPNCLDVYVYQLEEYLVRNDADPWNGSDTHVQLILNAHKLFDGFRHVYFKGDDEQDGYFYYQDMKVMAEILLKLHEIGPIE